MYATKSFSLQIKAELMLVRADQIYILEQLNHKINVVSAPGICSSPRAIIL